MIAYVKSFATYRTIKQATVISSAVVVDSLEADTSSVTVTGSGINRSDIGNWLIIGGAVCLISGVKPETDRTILTVASPLDLFTRPLELMAGDAASTIGGFIADRMAKNWTAEADPSYGIPYLVVSNTDATPYAAPDLDNNGCYKLTDYCRTVRKSYRVTLAFADAGNTLRCDIYTKAASAKRVSFDDGRSQLASLDYSRSGVSKLTVLQDFDLGKDDNGDPITSRERSVWYLAEDGSISQQVPARRAPGQWSTIAIKGKDDIRAKVTETFAKNKANHKLEFWSSRDLQVQDDCTFFVYGDLLESYISYKRKDSTDDRWYYKSGELAVTAAEKLRRDR